MNTITLMNLKVFVGLTAVLFGFSGAAGMYVTSFGVIDGNTYVNSPTFYPDDGRLYLDEQDADGSLEIEGGEKARFDSESLVGGSGSISGIFKLSARIDSEAEVAEFEYEFGSSETVLCSDNMVLDNSTNYETVFSGCDFEVEPSNQEFWLELSSNESVSVKTDGETNLRWTVE